MAIGGQQIKCSRRRNVEYNLESPLWHRVTESPPRVNLLLLIVESGTREPPTTVALQELSVNESSD